MPRCWHLFSQRFKVIHWLVGRLSGQSAAHGLAAFFILVYTSFLSFGATLCNHNVIEPSKPSNASAIAVLEFQGNLGFFETAKHIVFTVVILLLSVFIILLPTCLLLVYPALPQVQAKLQHSKYKALQCFSELKCLNLFSSPRIQQFGDLFQSSYKDNCRFFAGVLLLVRIVVVVAWNISRSRVEGYILMTALSIAVLAFHSLIHPHQRGWVNVVDSLMYAHLAAINLLAVGIYSNPASHQSLEESWSTLYQFALFAPGAYLVLYLASVLYRRMRRLYRKQPSTAPPVQTAGDNTYMNIENVVEVDPQADQDPVEEEQEMEKSYGSAAKRNARHQELWFSDDN